MIFAVVIPAVIGPNSVTISSGATVSVAYDAAFATTIGLTAADVLPAKFASPSYTATTGPVSPDSTTVPDPTTAFDSMSTNRTAPKGVPAPGANAITFAAAAPVPTVTDTAVGARATV